MKGDEEKKKDNHGPVHTTYIVLRNRVLSGFVLALPIFLTFIIIAWVYNSVVSMVLGPIYGFVVQYWRSERAARNGPGEDVAMDLPFWMEYVAAPIVTVSILVGFLFILGMFFKSRLHLAVDWILLHMPFVSWVYSVVLKVVNTLQSSDSDKPRFQRVVLVRFPHSGMKAPAFVTGSCTDIQTGKSILCVYVPTTPVPTSGYMLLVPEEEVSELSWTLHETLEAIVSGGVTSPPKVDYYPEGIEGESS